MLVIIRSYSKKKLISAPGDSLDALSNACLTISMDL